MVQCWAEQVGPEVRIVPLISNPDVMARHPPWEGAEVTQAAHEIFDGRARAAASRQHPVLVRFALQERHGTTIRERGISRPELN